MGIPRNMLGAVIVGLCMGPQVAMPITREEVIAPTLFDGSHSPRRTPNRNTPSGAAAAKRAARRRRNIAKRRSAR